MSLHRRELHDVTRIARAETKAGAAGDDGFAEPERDGGEPVLLAHRRQRIEVVRSRDAGDVRIETPSVPAADDALQHHRHLLFLEAVRRISSRYRLAARLNVEA